MVKTARFAGMAGYLTAAKTVNYLFKQNENGELDLDQDVFEQLVFQNKNPLS